MPQVERVLVIQTQGENAGAQEISRLLGAGLTARGYHVDHLFFYRKSEGFDAPPNTRYCTVDRPSTPLGAVKFLWALARGIREAKPDAILTFQHYGNTVGGAMARLVSSAPIIANQVSARMMMNWPVRQADLVLGMLGTFRIITVNSDDMLVDYGRRPSLYTRHLLHVPHGFARKTSTLSKPAARARLGLPADVPLIGTAARLHPIKRLDAAIRLLRHRPDWHLALAGQGEQESELRRLAADLGVADRAHFVGDLPPNEVGDFFACLDVFVFPSHAETFGLAAVEAAHAGLPVVVNDLPVLREVLSADGQSAAVFADAGDDAALAAAVARVFDDEALRRSLVQGGRSLASRYSLDAMVEEYDRMLSSLSPPANDGLVAAR